MKTEIKIVVGSLVAVTSVVIGVAYSQNNQKRVYAERQIEPVVAATELPSAARESVSTSTAVERVEFVQSVREAMQTAAFAAVGQDRDILQIRASDCGEALIFEILSIPNAENNLNRLGFERIVCQGTSGNTRGYLLSTRTMCRPMNVPGVLPVCPMASTKL